MKPLVSIIIPCYNQSQYLPDALNSVLDQTYTNWECIIVNDGSNDDTEEIALIWMNKDIRFKYFYKENGGLAETRNFGIQKSTGTYILPLDADDKIGKTYLEKAVKVLDENPDTGIVYCRAILFGEQNGKWKIPRYSLKRMLYLNNIFCSAVFRRTDYIKTNGYNKNMQYGYEDWDFWLSLIERGISVFQIPEHLFYYRMKENSMLRSVKDEKLFYSYEQIISNHLGLYRKNMKNPFLIMEYLHFRRGFTGDIRKDLLYIIGNFKLKYAIFFIRYKYYSFNRS